MADEKVPPTTDPGAIPAQPSATPAIKKSLPLILGLGALFGIVGLANLANFTKGEKKEAPASNLAIRPASPNAQQVRSFQAQQNLQAQKRPGGPDTPDAASRPNGAAPESAIRSRA